MIRTRPRNKGFGRVACPKGLLRLLICLLSGGLLMGAFTARADERGAQLFVQCISCHAVDQNDEQRHGPPLHRLFGRPAGSVPGYNYSEILRQAGNQGLVWDEQSLDALLADPRGYLPGLRMAIDPIDEPSDRHALISYLAAVYADGGPTVFVHDDPPVPDRLLALEGDPEYGAYLASECLTCHQADGTRAGIPAIIGWARQRFIRVMHAYRVKARDNSVMQSIAGALGDEEIAALASYLARPGQ